jgi:Holliday junction resolvasome RuvABC DNA-binding subunit
LDLDRQEREKQIKELNDVVFQELFKINGIRFSTATKILHTIYPEIIPMIDNPLQRKYKKEINHSWTKKSADKILIDFYQSLKIENNLKNLNKISEELTKNNLKHLTKIRIFDILWWSYLKAERLKNVRKINWSSMIFY